MNCFKKYCPNVWVAECDEQHEKGDVITLETKRGKEVDCLVHNLVASKNEKLYYSITRIESESYAERKASMYIAAADKSTEKSADYYNRSQEGREFLSLGQPILVGHHSEKKHRALLERNRNRMDKSVELIQKASDQTAKAEYWTKKSKEITLADPESLAHFSLQLEKAKDYHAKLKSGEVERLHAYSLQYARKEVLNLEKKAKIAATLWG